MSPSQASPSGLKPYADMITISTPLVAGSGSTSVRQVQDGGTTRYYICAQGIAPNASDGSPPLEVRGKGYNTSTTPPFQPPALDPQNPDDPYASILGCFDPQNPNNWYIQRSPCSGNGGQYFDIPVTGCGPQGGPPCGPANNPVDVQVAIWVRYSQPTGWKLQSQNFLGVCANDTQCGGGGPPKSKTQKTAGLAPQRVSVTALGFVLAGTTVFNGTWQLTLRQLADLVCLWDNGGDGQETPRVELCLAAPQSTEWRLRFQHREHQVDYIQVVEEWKWLGENTLCLREGVHKSQVPTSLRVEPL